MSEVSRGRLELRPATMEDARPLFDLANDRTVRENAFRPEAIEWRSHRRWFESRLASPDTRIWIVELNGEFVGQVRYDREHEDAATLSFSVVEGARRKGIGTRILVRSWSMGCEALSVPCVRGLVLPGNEPSVRTFQKAGFREVEPGRHAGRRCRIFVRCLRRGGS